VEQTGGDGKHLLIGFYDPCPKEAKMLSVKYFFRGRLHEIVIPDTGKLLMPLKCKN
jgi:DnaJ family protein C protein 11